MRTPLATLFLIGIGVYRVTGRILGLRSPCRFYPSCSTYAAETIRRQGGIRGLSMAVRRLLRCHPWNPGGIDLPEMETR